MAEHGAVKEFCPNSIYYDQIFMDILQLQNVCVFKSYAEKFIVQEKTDPNIQKQPDLDPTKNIFVVFDYKSI